MAAREISRRITEFLRRRAAPASSSLLAGEFLKIGPAGEDLATALLSPVLGEEGLVYREGVGWWFGAPSSPAEEGEQAAPPRRIACAVAVLHRPASSRIGGLCLIEVEAPRRRVERPRWAEISSLLEGAEAVFGDPPVEAPPILAGLARRGLPGPARVRSLAQVAREAVRIPRGSGLEAIASALGRGHREGGTPADVAEEIADCLIAAGEILNRKSTARLEGPALPGAGLDASPLTPEFLSRVPARPGVYRFFDADGKLLYVGKAADLRRRLSSYARPPDREGRSEIGRLGRGGARRSGGAPPAAVQIRRVEYQVLGSELEALLKEARLIASRSPRANVQREIRERGRAYGAGRSQALILPAKDGGAAVVFVRDGRLEGWCRLGPRGGGGAEALKVLRRMMRRRGSRPPSKVHPETEILNSWLARQRELVSRVDLDACLGPMDGLGLLRRAVAGFVASPRDVVLHR